MRNIHSFLVNVHTHNMDVFRCQYCISFFINIFYLCVYGSLAFRLLASVLSMRHRAHRNRSARNLNSTSAVTSWHIADVQSVRCRMAFVPFVIDSFVRCGWSQTRFLLCVRGQNTYVYILLYAQNNE